MAGFCIIITVDRKKFRPMKKYAKVAGKILFGLAVVTVAILRFGNTENGRMKRDSLTPTLNNLDSLL